MASAAATRSAAVTRCAVRALLPSIGGVSARSSSSSCSFTHPPALDPIAHIRSLIASLNARCLPPPEDRLRRIVLLGPPGVGKGTYGSLLSQMLGVPHISTGDLIREAEAEAASSKGGSSEEMEAMKKGKLLGDEVVLRLLWERLAKEFEEGCGYVLDGVPRTEKQAAMLEEAGVEVDVALNFRVADEEAMVAKCMGRRVCSECGHDYNLADVVSLPHLFLPSRLPPPSCASHLRIRDDDASESIVRDRLQVYSRNMAPVELHYHLRNKLFTIDVGPGAASSWPKILDAARGRQSKAAEAPYLTLVFDSETVPHAP